MVFLSKKDTVSFCKTSLFDGLDALFGNFFVDFLAFFLNVPAPPEGERVKRARLTRDADSRCTLAGGPRELFFAPRASFALLVGSEGRGYDSPKSIVKVSEVSEK